MQEEVYVNIGGLHVTTTGLLVEQFESFVPSEKDLAAAGDKFVSLLVFERTYPESKRARLRPAAAKTALALTAPTMRPSEEERRAELVAMELDNLQAQAIKAGLEPYSARLTLIETILAVEGYTAESDWDDEPAESGEETPNGEALGEPSQPAASGPDSGEDEALQKRRELLEAHTIDELRAIAAEYDFELTGLTRKADIIEAMAEGIEELLSD